METFIFNVYRKKTIEMVAPYVQHGYREYGTELLSQRPRLPQKFLGQWLTVPDTVVLAT